MVPVRIRIVIGMLVAAAISFGVMRYTSEADADLPNAPPVVNVKQLARDFSTTSSSLGNQIGTAITSIRLPEFTFPNFIVFNPPEGSEPTPEPTLADDTFPLPFNTPGENEPTEVPTSTPAYFPTNAPRPTTDLPLTQAPTVKPAATNTPKPTKPPKPTPTPQLPPVTDDVRPGTSLEEIMRDIEKRACVPYKLLMAIRTLEGGQWFNNMSASTTKMYNTYGWWKSASRATVCAGLAYYTQSGLIPAADSPVAYAESTDKTCTKAPIGDQSYDQKIMGIMQISEQEEQVTRKYTVKIVPGNFDRRVLFDNILIFAIATKNRAGKFPQPSCTDWPMETVKEVARIHASGSQGSCNYTYSQTGKSGNYCNEVWDLYKSFK